MEVGLVQVAQTPVLSAYSLTQLFWATGMAFQDLEKKPTMESHQVTSHQEVKTLVLNAQWFWISWALCIGMDAHLWVWRVTAIRIHVEVIRNGDCWACTCCRGTRSLSAADSADPVTNLISSTCDSFTTWAKEKVQSVITSVLADSTVHNPEDHALPAKASNIRFPTCLCSRNLKARPLPKLAQTSTHL